MTPPANNVPSRPLANRRLLWFLAIWTIVVIFVGAWLWRTDFNEPPESWVLGDTTQRPVAQRIHDWLWLAHVNLHRVYPWALLAPYIAALAYIFPLGRGRFARYIVLHLAACAAFIIGAQLLNSRTSVGNVRIVVFNSDHTGIISNRLDLRASGSDTVRAESITAFATNGRAPFITTVTTNIRPAAIDAFFASNHPPVFEKFFKNGPPPPKSSGGNFFSIFIDLLAYGAIAGLAHSVHYYRRYRERESRALALESTLAHARLDALRAQLHPHFLFNSLNAIAALLRRDPAAAESTLLTLSELLRLALNQSERQEIPLAEELDFVRRYLEIQQTRFADKLRVQENIDPAALHCLVPALALQPLIENAIRHAVEPSDQPVLIRLSARRQADSLVLTVDDDCPPLPADSPPAATKGAGIGLKNLRARLEMLYGPNHKLAVGPRPGGGFVVALEIPWRIAPAQT